MVADTLTGSRIRDRRLIRGLRQADLARKIGISTSYLNLIEHNRRRIGGKLLNALADALDVEVSVLNQGAEASLIAALREAEAAARQVATVTALVPLALADVVSALTANLRMIRRIGEIYGGRSGTIGSWRLARAVMGHLVDGCRRRWR